jgi:hypothetical protein
VISRAVFILVVCVGCGTKARKPDPSLKVCREFGQTCEFLPGKLGACVVRDNCSGEGCFTCQSQH